MSKELKAPVLLDADASEGSGDPNLSDPELVRLYESMRALDRALHDTMGALDVTLGREPSELRSRRFPMRELGSLREHLDAAAGRRPSARMPLDEMALETPDRTDDGDGDD